MIDRLMTFVGLVVWIAASAAEAQFFGPGEQTQKSPPTTVVGRTAAMVADPAANFFAAKYSLDLVNVTWEDTGRFFGSTVGPNISDVTIQVQEKENDDKYRLTCMPVVRFPNFSDKTADIPLDEFYLLVGNETKGRKLEKVSLKTYLGDLRSYLSRADSWLGDEKSLLAKRDTHALVSAQACFLPIPKSGIVEFNPVIFNYQSYEENPAVLVILATREGTSATVVDNKRDAFKSGFTWGQRLFFNQQGERASLTGQRKTDFEATRRPVSSDSPPSVEAAGEVGLNMVLLIQVPLKHKPLEVIGFGGGFGGGGAPFVTSIIPLVDEKSDVEEAVIGHGKVEGPFTEIDELKIERDPKFPVRVTVQFYKATSNGVVSDDDMSEMAAQINRVYRDRKYVGSLVLDGPRKRPTEYEGFKVEPPWWWASFWRRHEENTGKSRVETLRRLREIMPYGWKPNTRRQMIHAVRELQTSNP